MTHALITGATGFIGHHLVEHLTNRGDRVTCLVRPTSNPASLATWSPAIVYGDVTDLSSVGAALADVDIVYHLAGRTKSFHRSGFFDVNERGVANVLKASVERGGDIRVVVVSSLAAAGPAEFSTPRREIDPVFPVSIYGRSKLAGELVARKYASHMPITIVRPPIVLGEGDRDGFAMFDCIARWGLHAVPGFADNRVSVIHADDLVTALTTVAEQGCRVDGVDGDPSRGVYFVSADETPTYAELGRMIGRAIGRESVFIANIPPAALWAVAGISDLMGRIKQQPQILNWDKAREATSGSWTCSADQIMNDTGFYPALPLVTRLKQTAQWYFDRGWLKSNELSEHRSGKRRSGYELEQIRKIGQKTLR